jgi:hypothetical protein
MPITERGALGPGFDRRLKVALDAVVPSAPLFARYFLTPPVRSSRPWRFASALVGVGAVGVMALSAFAETGSANPVVWTQRAASTIQSVSHIPEASPPPSPTPDTHVAAPVSQQTGTSRAASSPDHQTEPSNTAQPTERPQESPPGDRFQPPEPSHSTDPGEHPSPSPEPSDSSGHKPGQDPTFLPPPNGHGGGQHGH